MNQPFLHTYTPNKPVWHALEQNQNIHERVSRDFTPDYKSKIHLKGFQGTEMIRWRIKGTGSVFLNNISGREEYWKEHENSHD